MIINNENFEKEVLNSDIPVVVDFYAEWCGPCKMLAPILEEIGKDFEGKIKIGKVNVDNEMNLVDKYQIASIPTLIFFKDGKVYDVSIGLLDKNALKNAFEKLL